MGDWAEEIAGERRVGPPAHPGEVLEQDWLEPLGINPSQLAKALGVDRRNIYDIVGGRRAVSAGMTLRLARWSGMRAGFWLGLQADYDLQMVEWRRVEDIAGQAKPLQRTG